MPAQDCNLEDRRALVTGGTKGIGTCVGLEPIPGSQVGPSAAAGNARTRLGRHQNPRTP
jgi:hypothetical protein